MKIIVALIITSCVLLVLVIAGEVELNQSAKSTLPQTSTEDDSGDPIPTTCLEEQKQPGPCTREHVPVCGDNEVTYSNSCEACRSGFIDTYVLGECAL